MPNRLRPAFSRRTVRAMTDRKQMQGPAIAALAGCVLVVLGTLMTWITVSGGFVPELYT